MNSRILAALGLALAAPLAAAQDEAPSNEELYEIIQAQQAEIDRLVGARENIETAGRTTIGAYGELHYNNLDSGTGMDYHRFVVFLNHAFTEEIKFYSELEFEHSLIGEGKPGEVELEQAYVDFAVGEGRHVRGGLFLVPVGILNETHEPPTFYGVERNPVESQIIPTTWWEGGAAFTQHTESGFSYDLALHSGLNMKLDTATGLVNYGVRGSRQKVAKALAEELAVSARLKYTGIAGLELAATVLRQNDMTQDPAVDGGAGTLVEAHAVWNQGPFSLRALYAGWNFDGDQAELQGTDQQNGYYVEGGYKLNPRWGVFARYSEWDTGGLAAETAKSQTNLGLNYWPHPNVVVKFDIQNQGKAADDNGFNLGIGYQF